MTSVTAPFPHNLPCFPYQQPTAAREPQRADDAPFIAVRMMWISLFASAAFPLGFAVTACLWFTVPVLPVLVLFLVIAQCWQLPPALALVLFIIYTVTRIINTTRYPN